VGRLVIRLWSVPDLAGGCSALRGLKSRGTRNSFRRLFPVPCPPVGRHSWRATGHPEASGPLSPSACPTKPAWARWARAGLYHEGKICAEIRPCAPGGTARCASRRLWSGNPALTPYSKTIAVLNPVVPGAQPILMRAISPLDPPNRLPASSEASGHQSPVTSHQSPGFRHSSLITAPPAARRGGLLHHGTCHYSPLITGHWPLCHQCAVGSLATSAAMMQSRPAALAR